VTILFTTLTGFMYLLLYERTSPLLALTPVVAGLVADLLLGWLDVSPNRPIRLRLRRPCADRAVVLEHGGHLGDRGHMGWTPELWSGTIILTAPTGVGLAPLAPPPPAGRSPRRIP
jgi:hypothetical protein